ncbi:MAG: DUF134 domain-containing protein [Clostridia bacterium]|nr:DUF134 domain-containing protein [Clostridia bacterium]
MARRPITRWVENMPLFNKFKPAGVPAGDKETINLAVEELEAIRLKDLEGLDQESCAVRMKISRPTFHRVLSSARLKVAKALVEGSVLLIEGGDYKIHKRKFNCSGCGHHFEVPFGTSKRGIDMVCPQCNGPNVHRIDRGGHGCGKQPWGRKRGQKP